MYGIVDFEEQVNKLQPEELSPHLSTDLERIQWPQERDELLPKLLNKQKFVYKSDYLSDRLVEHQERAQAFQLRLTVNVICIVTVIILNIWIRTNLEAPQRFTMKL